MSEETEVVEEQTQVENHVEVKQEVKTPDIHSKTAKERNWDEAREVLKLQKQRIEDLEARLSKQIPVVPEEPDEFENLDPDDYMTVAKAKAIRDSAKKVAAKEAAESAKKVLQEYTQQQSIAMDEQRMRAKHEDFDFVIENYAIPMIKNDPALAYKIQNSKNPAETAYKLAKISDEYEGANMKQQTSPKAEKILKNSQRPVSGNALGTPLKSQADQFASMKPGDDVWKLSQQYAKGA